MRPEFTFLLLSNSPAPHGCSSQHLCLRSLALGEKWSFLGSAS